MSLTWYDCIMRSGIAISHEDAKKGWPERLFCWRVAQLQRPNQERDPLVKERQLALHWALADAVNSGEVASVKKSLAVEVSGLTRNIRGEVSGTPYARPRRATRSEAYVTAADFIEWLSRTGEKPSDCIKSWYHATSTQKEQAVPKRGSQKALNPEQEAEIARRYKTGDTVAALASDFGVSRKTIDRSLVVAKLKAAPKPKVRTKGSSG